LAWCLIGGRGKGAVSSAASASLGNGYLLTVFGQITKDMPSIPIENESAWRNRDDQLSAAAAVAIVRAALSSGRCSAVFAMNNGRETVRARHGANNDVASVAAISSIGAAFGYVFFSPKAAAAIASVAALDVNRDAINKHDPTASRLK
jgi:hypothetical protein